MLFHISYVIRAEHRDQAQARFLETGGLPPDGVTMLGRWHSAAGRVGFLVAESSDAVAISRWTQSWSDLLTFEVTPVLSDEDMITVLS